MKVKDVMAADEIKYCTTETKLASAAKIMKENNRGALPVVDDEHKVVGIITDRDICLSLADHKAKAAGRYVIDILPKTKVQTITTEASVSEALKKMRLHKVGRLPVTDPQGKLKGMVSINNLLSDTISRKQNIGTIAEQNETLAKTIKSLFERNNLKPAKEQVNPELEMEAADD